MRTVGGSYGRVTRIRATALATPGETAVVLYPAGTLSPAEVPGKLDKQGLVDKCSVR